MTEPEALPAAAPEAVAPAGCPAQDAVGRPCRGEVGHEGPHAVEMDPLEVVYRQAVQAMIARRNATAQRTALVTGSLPLLNQVLDNQIVILNGLAMVLDVALRAQGLPGEIRILPKAGDGRA
jgi:hypothetical protein